MRLLAVAIEQERDIVLARQRTRQIAGLLGFDAQDQTRITTALSEIVRNALEYGRGGRVDYRLAGEEPAQSLEIVVRDNGPGIADLEGILSGRRRSTTGMGVGIPGARRLMDQFGIESASGAGTMVTLGKRLPRGTALTRRRLAAIGEALAKEQHADPLVEIRSQNRDLLVQLDALNQRQEELRVLNEELQDTNRGVVALYAELNDRADHLRQADELKSRFLSNMSHEFRTPLNSILALSRLLLGRKDGELTAEQTKQVQFVQKAAESLTELINDLLDLAKVEAGRTVIAAVEFTVTDLFSTLRGMLRPLLVGDAVTLVFDLPIDTPPLKTDESKVSQILRNFISNALKFTEHGEVRVSAAHDPEADTITFAVRDTGIGIAAKDIGIIWQEFGQVANPLQGRVKGTGLGLPLSKKLAELLGGEVSVESAPGEGSTFAVTLPRRYPAAAAEDEEPRWVIDPARVTVLAIDDNPAETFTYERILDGTRYQLIAARSVAQAQRALERVCPAAVILDIVLEGEDSWRFLIETKHKEATQRIPFLVVTATGDERKARNLGADGYLDKPIDQASLVATLDELTGRRGVARILLVDDEEIARYLVRQLLPRGAFYLEEASGALEAMEIARKERPDAIILDLNMKPVDGFSFLEMLGRSEIAATPVVVLSSLIPDEAQRRQLAGAARILSKSDLTTAALVAALRSAMAGVAGAPA